MYPINTYKKIEIYPITKWENIQVKVPNYLQKVLVLYKYKEITKIAIATYHNKNEWVLQGLHCGLVASNNEKITHWHPLPEIPARI